MARDEDLMGASQELKKHLHPLRAGLAEDGGGDADNGSREDFDPVARLEEVLLARDARFVAGGGHELFNQLRRDDGRLAAKADQAEGAVGGTDGGAVLAQEVGANSPRRPNHPALPADVPHGGGPMPLPRLEVAVLSRQPGEPEGLDPVETEKLSDNQYLERFSTIGTVHIQLASFHRQAPIR